MNSYPNQTKEDDSIQAKQGQQMRLLIESLQRKLRERLLDELWEDRENLEDAVLQPDTYLYRFQSYKDKYLDKLSDLQRILNELSALEKKVR